MPMTEEPTSTETAELTLKGLSSYQNYVLFTKSLIPYDSLCRVVKCLLKENGHIPRMATHGLELGRRVGPSKN